MAVSKKSVIRIRHHQMADTENTGRINSPTLARIIDMRNCFTVNDSSTTVFKLNKEKLDKQLYRIRIIPISNTQPDGTNYVSIDFRDHNDTSILSGNYLYVDLDSVRETDSGATELMGTAILANGASMPILIQSVQGIKIALKPVGRKFVLMSSFSDIDTYDE